MQLLRRRRRRTIPTLMLHLLLLLTLVAAGGPASAAPAGATADPLAKVEQAVQDQLAGKGVSTVFVEIAAGANLTAAPGIQGHAQRVTHVYEQLTSAAQSSQAGVRQLLEARGASFEPFWIVNAILVKDASKDLVMQLAGRADVERVVLSRTHPLPKPLPGKDQPTVNAVEWNIDRIRAPEVWDTFGVRGEGIVVANIDTGVQFDHPALVNSYRGNNGDGTFDHNYNWFDPSEICGSPSLVPCDNQGHGTHTMGTMVGDDGAGNQIGVAPGVRWVAAKGCEFNTCSDPALLAAGQWVIAPTDLNGENPRPDLAPHVVNNSWGSDAPNTFYQETVDAWVAAGIFPSFSNGNAGPGCDTAGSPGEFINAYGVGAFDIDNEIAGFSSRGPSSFDPNEIKPNLSAPGVDVRSSIPGNGYGLNSGTSMAAPHLTATVALMWSASPVLVGDIASTRQILDDTAVDVDDTSCGGTADDNNNWGEGMLDAFTAVLGSPRGDTAELSGTVTNAATGAPIAGATVDIAGPISRTVETGADGTYSAILLGGTYTVSAGAFGFVTQSATVVVTAGTPATQDFALPPAPAGTVSGTVSDDQGDPVANAVVTIEGTPIPPATTGADGGYSFASVPEGEYDVSVTAGQCLDPQTQHLVVDGDETLDFSLVGRSDSFGYSCRPAAFDFIEATNPLPISGDDDAATVDLPFAFQLYGVNYSQVHVASNGFVNFLELDDDFSNDEIPTTAEPNAAVYPLWDDFVVDGDAVVLTETLGEAPNRRFVIEWRDVRIIGTADDRATFELVLHENSSMTVQWATLPATDRGHGDSATIGLENETGTVAFVYSFNEAVLQPGTAVTFRLANTAFLTGAVNDANDGAGIPGATVRALQDGTEVATTTTGEDGRYNLALRLGSYTIEASATNYGTATSPVTLDEELETVTQDFTLATALARFTPDPFQVIAKTDQQRTRRLTIHNDGGLQLEWSVTEGSDAGAPAAAADRFDVTDVSWLSVDPTSGSVRPGDEQVVEVSIDTTGLAPGVYDSELVFTTNGGRQAEVVLPVRLIVPAYRVAINAGDGRLVDGNGDPWGPDQRYRQGSFGFRGRSRTIETRHSIAGVDLGSHDRLYKSQRLGMFEYRFDGLAPGVYQVELNFAELRRVRPNRRLVDVILEQELVLPAHDVRNEVGRFTADDHSFLIRVDDGQLNVRFISRRGKTIINALRVTHRPDQG